MDSTPLVSVIIPTKNSTRTIEICLQSIKKQSYPKIEITVVDNYSRDKTKEIAQKYAKVYNKGTERSSTMLKQWIFIEKNTLVYLLNRLLFSVPPSFTTGNN